MAEINEGLALARERGDRAWESQMQGQLFAPMVILGRWDESVPLGATLLDGILSLDAMVAAAFLSAIAAARGDDASARALPIGGQREP